MADSSRWERFQFRDDDIVISTPSKCGTTWMQNIVGMLVLDRPVLDTPIGTLSPWLDMLVRTDEEVFDLLDAQQHRRWIKTHTPLDGLPLHPTVTYITVIRSMSRSPTAITARTRTASGPMTYDSLQPVHLSRPSTEVPTRSPTICGGSSTTTCRRPVADRAASPTSVNR